MIRQTSGGNLVLGRFRLSATTNAAALRAPKTALPRPEIAKLLQIPADKRTETQQKKLATYQRSAAPELIADRRRLAEAKKAKTDFEATLPRCLVSVVADEPRVVRILVSGPWNSGPSIAAATSSGDSRAPPFLAAALSQAVLSPSSDCAM